MTACCVPPAYSSVTVSRSRGWCLLTATALSAWLAVHSCSYLGRQVQCGPNAGRHHVKAPTLATVCWPIWGGASSLGPVSGAPGGGQDTANNGALSLTHQENTDTSFFSGIEASCKLSNYLQLS